MFGDAEIVAWAAEGRVDLPAVGFLLFIEAVEVIVILISEEQVVASPATEVVVSLAAVNYVVAGRCANDVESRVALDPIVSFAPGEVVVSATAVELEWVRHRPPRPLELVAAEIVGPAIAEEMEILARPGVAEDKVISLASADSDVVDMVSDFNEIPATEHGHDITFLEFFREESLAPPSAHYVRPFAVASRSLCRRRREDGKRQGQHSEQHGGANSTESQSLLHALSEPESESDSNPTQGQAGITFIAPLERNIGAVLPPAAVTLSGLAVVRPFAPVTLVVFVLPRRDVEFQPKEAVVTAATEHHVEAKAALDPVVTAARPDDIPATLRMDVVTTRASVDFVIPVATSDEVGAIPAEEDQSVDLSLRECRDDFRRR